MDIRSWLKKPARQYDAAVSVPVAEKNDAQPSQSNIELEAQSTKNFTPLDTNQPDDILSQLNTDINCETQSSNSSFPPETCQADDEVSYNINHIPTLVLQSVQLLHLLTQSLFHQHHINLQSL